MAGGDARTSTRAAGGVAESPSVSRYAWFRRRPAAAVATASAAPALRLRGGMSPARIVLADDDFVVCDHPGCGALRPVVTAGSFEYCPGCGRL